MRNSVELPMTRRLPMILCLVVLLVSLGGLLARLLGWGEATEVIEDMAVTAVFGPDTPAPDDVDGLRDFARAAGEDCGLSVPRWWDLVDEVGEDAEAYRAIAECSRRGQVESVLAGTERLFEESPVLSWVPVVLDEIPFGELVPVLSEVETREHKDWTDYRLIAMMRRRVGDPAGTVDAFRRALSMDPGNAELHLALGNELVVQGHMAEARVEFRDALAAEGTRWRLVRLYAAAVAYPLWFLGVVVGVIGLGSIVVLRGETALLEVLDRVVDGVDRAGQRLLVTGAAITVLVLGALFVLTGNRLAFGFLAASTVLTGVRLLMVPFRAPLTSLAAAGVEWVAAIAGGTVYRRLSRLDARTQLAVLVLSGFTILFLVPLIPRFDLRLAALFLASMLLLSTLGSLMLSMLEEAASLRTTLLWLGVAGTLPLLLFFLYIDLRDLLEPLRHGQMWTVADWSRVVGYLILWGLGAGAALLLARILSRSILRPLHQVVNVLQEIREGDFDARVPVERRDEIGTVAIAVNEMAAGLREREDIKRTFRRYVDPTVAERLMAQDEDMERCRTVDATVLFSDVRGFTSLSESLSPAEVVGLINDYFARMEPVVRRWGGAVDKFMGDGMMAVWDVPEPRRDGPFAGHPGEELAVRAGLDMLEELDGFNGELEARGLPPLSIGIGIHSGELIAGPVGSPERLEYTVIGDTVNTAARVEHASRDGAPLQVTGAVAAVVRSLVRLEERAPVALKGKREPVVLYRVLGLLPSTGSPPPR